MKSVKLMIIALVSLISINSAFASGVTQKPHESQTLGTVSASGAYSLDDLTEKLADKAESKGATSFKIISAGGENKMYGVAEIYK